MGTINSCMECLKKQQKIDRLTEQVQSLKSKLRIRERKEKEGFFGSSTPSSQIPVKPNTASKEKKKPGAKKGHKGHGRKSFDKSEADQVIEVFPQEGDLCPDCALELEEGVIDSRSVLESTSIKAKRVLYVLHEKRCPKCKVTFKSRAPSVLPRSLYGNQLIATASVMHYLHGIPMGRICEQIGIGPGSLVQIYHRLSRMFSPVCDKLIVEYRNSLVRHADETGWRTNGKNGYAWLFATPDNCNSAQNKFWFSIGCRSSYSQCTDDYTQYYQEKGL